MKKSYVVFLISQSLSLLFPTAGIASEPTNAHRCKTAQTAAIVAMLNKYAEQIEIPLNELRFEQKGPSLVRHYRRVITQPFEYMIGLQELTPESFVFQPSTEGLPARFVAGCRNKQKCVKKNDGFFPPAVEQWRIIGSDRPWQELDAEDNLANNLAVAAAIRDRLNALDKCSP